jgi:hypothetical protein
MPTNCVLFLDTNIVIALVFEEERFKSVVQTFKTQVQRSKIPTYISPLVEDEFHEKANHEVDMIGRYVGKLRFRISMEKGPRLGPMQPVDIGLSDFLSVDKTMVNMYDEIAKEDATKKPAERDLDMNRMGIIEGWVCDKFSELFAEQRKVSLESLLADLGMLVKERRAILEDRLLSIRASLNCEKYEGKPDGETIRLLDEIYQGGEKDKKLLASARAYMKENNSSAIFVTTDRTLILKRDRIGEETGVWCATPASAFPYYLYWGLKRVFK